MVNTNVSIPTAVQQAKNYKPEYNMDKNVTEKGKTDFESLYQKLSNDKITSNTKVKESMDKAKKTVDNGEGKSQEELLAELKEETNTPEELMLILVNLYLKNSEMDNTSTETGPSETTDGLSNPNQFNITYDENEKNHGVQQLLNKLLAADGLDKDLAKLIHQYRTIASKGMENTPIAALQTTEGEAAKDLDVFKNMIINQIESMVKETTNTMETVQNKVDKFVELLGNLKGEVKFNSNNSSLSAKDEENNFNNQDGDTSEYDVKMPINSSEIKIVKISSAEKKEEKFLMGMLDEDSSKKDEKLNLFMNQFKTEKNDFTVVKPQTEVVVNKTNIVNDLIKTVKFMDSSNIKELKVSINPKEIGELLITVTVEGGKLKANIAANSKDSYNLLNANLNDIKNALNSNDIRIQEVSVNIYNGDTTFFKDGSQNQEARDESSYYNAKGNRNNLEEDFEKDESENSIIESQINILA